MFEKLDWAGTYTREHTYGSETGPLFCTASFLFCLGSGNKGSKGKQGLNKHPLKMLPII